MPSKPSNPLTKVLKSFRSQHIDRSHSGEASHRSSVSDPSTSEDAEHEEHRERLRWEAFAEQSPLLPHLLSAVHDYQLTHGSLIKLVSHPSTIDKPIQHTVLARPIGASLVPTLWPEERFNEAWHLQPLLQELYAKVANDPDYLFEICQPCIADDDTGRTWTDAIITGLWKVYEAVRDDPDGLGCVQDIEAGLCRGDWMLHVEDDSERENQFGSSEDSKKDRPLLTKKPILKQVEFNAIATAGGSHSELVTNMHAHFLRTGIYSSLAHSSSPNVNVAMSPDPDQTGPSTPPPTTLPFLPHPSSLPLPQTPVQNFASTLAQAHSLYGPARSPGITKTAVLMVVQHSNENIADERPIEYALWNMGVPCFRIEYRDILQRTWFRQPSSDIHVKVQDEQPPRTRGNEANGRELLFAPFAPLPSHPSFQPASEPPRSPGITYEASVIYLRASLSRSELLPGPLLLTRLHLERSSAIKCPSVLGQLAASKKVQCHLTCTSGALEKFVSEEEADVLRRRSMRMWDLGDEGGKGRMVLDRCARVAEKDGRQETPDLSTPIPSSPSPNLTRTVLKPLSSEGGGHNIFSPSIEHFYTTTIIPQCSQASYMLMEKIRAPLVQGALVSTRGLWIGWVVQELGILGGVVYRRGGKEKGELEGEGALGVDILVNEVCGYTLKSKPPDVQEMSVVKGYGCFDSACLVDWETYFGNAGAT